MKKFLSLVILAVLMVGFSSLIAYSKDKKEQAPPLFPVWLDKGLELKWEARTGLGKISEDEVMTLVCQKINFLHSCTKHKKLEPLLRLAEITILQTSRAKGVAIIELSHDGISLVLFKDHAALDRGNWEKSLYLSGRKEDDYILRGFLRHSISRYIFYELIKLTDEDIFEIIGKEFDIEKLAKSN